MSIPVPKWTTDNSIVKRDTVRLRNRYLVKSAALYYSPEGQLETLARDLGCAYSTLVGLYAPGTPVISPDMAIRLEKLLTRDILPRELIRPDVFKF